MTLIVGILCADGVVVAADGAATYGVMGQMTVKQPVKKLDILSGSIIVGVSGPVGMGQRYTGEIARLWDQKKFKGNDQPDQTMTKIREAMIPIIKEELSMAQAAQPLLGNIAVQGFVSSTLVAMPVDKKPCLFQFNHQGSPEQATTKLPFVAIGSGQMTADPFLAFIRRLLWKDTHPSLAHGIFAAQWTVHHAITTSPGGVAGPIQIAILDKDCKARELTDGELEEQVRCIGAMEDAMHAAARNVIAPEQAGPAPAPP
jgi:20S proteasome alpha/beta subunit